MTFSMAYRQSLAGLAVALLVPFAASQSGAAFTQALCSTENTASGSSTNDIYASAGSCHDNCNGYAYAVVQGQDCWCTNEVPADTVSTSQCGETCPGYPYEFCGASGYFGYVEVNTDLATSAGSSSPTEAPEEQPQSTPSPSTVTVRETETATQPASTSLISIEPSSTRRPATTRTTTPTSTWSPTPYASVRTVQGGVETVTVTPTLPPQAAQTESEVPQEESQGGFWNDTGKVAGTFTAVGIIIAALIGAGVFFFFKRRNQARGSMTINSIDEDAPTSSNGAPYMVDRRRSNLTLTTAGIGGLTRGSSNDKSPHDKTPGSMSRRGSLPMNHDQRLNPAALWNAHPNGSHASVASFRDDQDYSRPVLHVRNPDPDA